MNYPPQLKQKSSKRLDEVTAFRSSSQINVQFELCSRPMHVIKLPVVESNKCCRTNYPTPSFRRKLTHQCQIQVIQNSSMQSDRLPNFHFLSQIDASVSQLNASNQRIRPKQVSKTAWYRVNQDAPFENYCCRINQNAPCQWKILMDRPICVLPNKQCTWASHQRLNDA